MKGSVARQHRWTPSRLVLHAFILLTLLVSIVACAGGTAPPEAASPAPGAEAPGTAPSPVPELEVTPPSEQSPIAGSEEVYEREEPGESPAPPMPDSFSEAPMLAEQVEAGDLPPVEERLPSEPIVIQPVEEVGQYGGTWRMAVVTDDGIGWFNMINMVEPYLRWNLDSTDTVPNLLRDWEWNEDATEVVVQFREGIKWSDGEPLTVDDYLFWWEDMVLNEDIPVTEPSGTRVAGELMEVEKVDDYTLKFSFAVPNPLFLEYHSRGFYHSSAFVLPRHYMEQFHPAYNDEVDPGNVEELMARYDTTSRQQYADMPVFTAWQPVEFESGVRYVYERNPYYWKVDTEGNQLPYIDRVEIRVVQEPQIVTLLATSGELDAQFRDFPIRDLPLIADSAEQNDYRIVQWNRGDAGWPSILVGYDYEPDEEIEDLLWDKRFRQALSWAINRPRINNTVSLGLAQPRQAALSANSPEFQTPEGRQVFEAWANSYAAHEPETAEQLLDEVGVVDADGDGWRDRTDGDPLELIVDVDINDRQSVDAADLIKEDWEAVGLRTVINALDGTTISDRAMQGEYMLWARGSNAVWGLISAPSHWTPVEYVSYAVAPRIGQYYQTGGEAGIPPRDGSMLEQLQEAYTELIQIVDPEERTRRLLETYQIHIDEGPINIGTVAEHPSPIVLKNNFRNVPEFGVLGPWDLGYPGTTMPEQYFIRQQ